MTSKSWKHNVNLTTPNSYATLKELLQKSANPFVRPIERMPLSEWAKENIYLAGGSGPEVGPYRYELAPYQRQILDVCGDPRTRKVVMMLAAQTGKTIMQGCIGGYFMAADPCPILAVLPSNNSAKKWGFSKLVPMLHASPLLHDLLLEDSILKKVFPGGYMVLVGAKSVDAFRMLSVRVLLLDEVDAWPYAISDEGSPLSLARGRTTAWWNSVEILVSTPTTKETSLIYPEFMSGDQRHYYVPCPHCGQYQILSWRSRTINYTNDDPKTAHFLCQFNGEAVASQEWREKNHYYDNNADLVVCAKTSSEAKKMEMLRKGEWIQHNPEADYPSFWLPATYSPWFSWEQLVREWVTSKTPDQQKSFIQTRLAEPWEERTDRIDAHLLSARREEYNAPCPDGVGIIIGTADVQQDRVECNIWGYGVHEEVWHLDHVVFHGQVYQEQVFDELEKFIHNTSYANKHGAQVQVNAWAIDTGAFTPQVYPFLRKMTALGVPIYGVKGSSNIKSPPTPNRPSTNRQYKIQIWEAGVNEIKNILVPRMLQEPPGAGTLHLSLRCDDEFLNQLTAEQRVRETDKKTGLVKTYWKKYYVRNEILDTYVYSYFVYLKHFVEKNVDVSEAAEIIKATEPHKPKEEKKAQQLDIYAYPTDPFPKKKSKLATPHGGNWYDSFRV